VYVPGRSRLRPGTDPHAGTGGYHHRMAAITARLRLPVAVQDTLLAAFVTLFQIRGTVLVAPAGEADRLTEPGYLGYALLAASGAALLIRRRWPVTVFAALAGISVIYYTAGYPDGPGWVALFVAVYTLTAHGDGQRSLKIVTVVLAVLTAVWLFTADLNPLNAAGWVFFRVGGAIMAAALGESVRTHRVLTEQAKDRAEQAEQTKEQEARRRADTERLRIAREVHDTVAHAIAIINVQAGVTAHILDRRPEQARATLTTIEQTSARALHELRTTLGMLRDVDNDLRAPTPGLDQIESLSATAREAGLDVTVQMPSPPPGLPSAIEHAAYRILQESITNVIRHAGPAHVIIALTYSPHDLHIQITDDGPGTDHHVNGGRGITGMRERCAILGGDLTAGPHPSGGFQVQARLPLPTQPAAHP
jgi:signal transduction histidine kinase